MKSLVKFIKESKGGDKIDAGVYHYLMQLADNCKDKEIKTWVCNFLEDNIDSDEFQYKNINGKPTDKIKISDEELLKWAKEFVNEYSGEFVIVNPKHDLYIHIVAENNCCSIHYKNSDETYNKFFDDVETTLDVKAYAAGKNWQDPSAYQGTFSNYYTKKEAEEDDDEDLIDVWIDETASNICNKVNNLLDLAKNMLTVLFNGQKTYNKYKSAIEDKDTFIYFEHA